MLPGATIGRFRFPLYQREGIEPIAFEPTHTAHEFYPGTLMRTPKGWVWGGDGRNVEAANDAHFDDIVLWGWH